MKQRNKVTTNAMTDKQFDKLLDDLEDRSEYYQADKPSIFFSDECRESYDKCLAAIQSMYANERLYRDGFDTEEQYKQHKEELRDREIAMLLKVRDCNPDKIDWLISLLD